jgi:hypothetical protein
MTPSAPRFCERCKEEWTVKPDRFCKKCKKAVLAELKAAGYLGPAPRQGPGKYRDQDSKENERETRYGVDR